MQKYELDKYLNSPELISEKISEFIKKEIIKTENRENTEIQGHLLKSERNLKFVNDTIQLDYFDWAITGCYYASYHAALALIMTKGFSCKNHLATILLLIKNFYNKGLNKEDIQSLVTLLDYQDILFYVESKNKREDATYSTKTAYTKQDVEQLRIKSTLFVSKVKDMLKN
ncbi:HEPN domain-containing protein [Candidatus Woesearchaeota archaeon]|nr:HEPN domain-containing protein [Candidatus Woesearchaeota archaeon]